MLITVSILCYNYGRYLTQAIESALDQQGKRGSVEVLVLDDGSTDNTPEVCERYRSDIRVIRSANEGFGPNLTKAIACASGDYICLMDGDDYFDCGKIRAVEQHISNGQRLIVHDQYFVSESGDLLCGGIPQQGGNTSTLCVRRSDALTMLPVENELSFHAIGGISGKVLMAESLSYYRVHDCSMTQRAVPGRQNTYLAGVTHRLAAYLEKTSIDSFPWIGNTRQKRRLANYYRSQAYYNELEASLEQKQRASAFLACARMLLFAARSNRGIGLLHVKMIAKMLLMRPSFFRLGQKDARKDDARNI